MSERDDSLRGDMEPVAPVPDTPDESAASPRKLRRREGATDAGALFAHGEPMVWLTGGALMICLWMVVLLLGYIIYMGAATFWPLPVTKVTTYEDVKVPGEDGKTKPMVVLGEPTRSESYELTKTMFLGLPDIYRDKLRPRFVDEDKIKNPPSDYRLRKLDFAALDERLKEKVRPLLTESTDLEDAYVLKSTDLAKLGDDTVFIKPMLLSGVGILDAMIDEDASITAQRTLYRTGNFELTGKHFVWVNDYEIKEESRPDWWIVFERTEQGRFYGEPMAFLHVQPWDMLTRMRFIEPEQLKEIRVKMNERIKSLEAELGPLRTKLAEVRQSKPGEGASDYELMQHNDRVADAEREVEKREQFIKGLRESLPKLDEAFETREGEAYGGYLVAAGRSLSELSIVTQEIIQTVAMDGGSWWKKHNPEGEALVRRADGEAHDRVTLKNMAGGDRIEYVIEEEWPGPEKAWEQFRARHDEARNRYREIKHISREQMGELAKKKDHARLEVSSARLELKEARLKHDVDSPEVKAALENLKQARQAATDVEESLEERRADLTEEIALKSAENREWGLFVRTAGGSTKHLEIADIVRAYPANQLGMGDKMGVYGSRWMEFLTHDPREANSEGGVWPAIFGTVVMTLIMCIAVVPFGVLAALYLREYAKGGFVISAVRIAINNLAGVPSIVFGVFGLGFFCYLIGKYIDGGPERGLNVNPMDQPVWWLGVVVLAALMIGAVVAGFFSASNKVRGHGKTSVWLGRAAIMMWITAAAMTVLLLVFTPYFEGFYRARLEDNQPTFGKGALIWASFTLALLTLPVVIVATEEALSAVPSSMREGSYACGASKWQTIRRIILPRAMPGIMTGTILAMARGAGEVAPLMLVGVIKYTEKLPFSWHADEQFGVTRSFMHLGFHIYDVGFQSQNSEAAKPMVFTTTLLLILIVATLNIAAIWLRARLRKKFVTGQF